MEKQEFEQLKETLILKVDESLQEVYNMDRKFIAIVQKETLKPLKMAPSFPPVVDTFKGIIGFHNYLSEHNPEFPHDKFLTTALHDIAECSANWAESWFSPRTTRYIEFYK